MAQFKPSVETLSQLEIATRTNKPVILAPEEFQSELDKVATRYINLYARRYTANEVVGMMELQKIVKNRFENLTVAGLADGSISKPADVQTLLNGNAMMEPIEERAIIEAYHSGVNEAMTYIYIFFSFKVYDYMHTSKRFGNKNEAEMYDALQTYLYTIVEKFNFNIIKNGGLSTKYYNQMMCDYVREQFEGKENSFFTYGRRQVTDLNKVRQIAAEDWKTLSIEEISKKYGIPKVSLRRYLDTQSVIRLDSACIDSDGCLSDNYENFSDNSSALKDVEECVATNQRYEQWCVLLEKQHIDKRTAESIKSAFLFYDEMSQIERGKTKKAPQRVYKNTADEVGVPVKVVEKVIHSFGEIFS